MMYALHNLEPDFFPTEDEISDDVLEAEFSALSKIRRCGTLSDIDPFAEHGSQEYAIALLGYVPPKFEPPKIIKPSHEELVAAAKIKAEKKAARLAARQEYERHWEARRKAAEEWERGRPERIRRMKESGAIRYSHP